MKVGLPVNLIKRREKKSGVLRKTNAARSNGERRTEGQLPYKKKGDELSEPVGVVNLFQISIRPTRGRQRSAQFRPYQTVAHGKDSPKNPPEHRLRSAHGRNNQWHRNEWPHPNHVDHVE